MTIEPMAKPGCILHIFRSEPDRVALALAGAWRDKGRNLEFHLYRADPDYDRLAALIFEADKVLTWR
ncbi:MAG: hypothetical protein V1816_17365 [Pseudomonadota bacterium]